MRDDFRSWGGGRSDTQLITSLHWIPRTLPNVADANGLLPCGMGRSYGDSCLNDNGMLLNAVPLDHFISFDSKSGILRAEAGVTLESILKIVVPMGWFLPVTPGTKFVTLGGAVANDVHGKNHHRAGSIACHVERLEILRTDIGKKECSPTENSDLFKATVGGLGLTGLITWVELRLKPVVSAYMQVDTIQFGSLPEYFDISKESDGQYEYTVAWVDALAQGNNIGRGIFFRGNHSDTRITPPKKYSIRNVKVPFELPAVFLNPMLMRSFNSIYFSRNKNKLQKMTHYEPFFYPLDSIQNWNRIYGKQGFYQFQCVVPLSDGMDTVNELLERASRARQGSFLSVLKTFGQAQPLGMLSFPRPGVTLALDFPNRGRKTRELLDALDNVVKQVGGVVYPAKDARMSAESFQHYYPNWQEFAEFIDPNFSSSFWRRVTGDAQI